MQVNIPDAVTRRSYHSLSVWSVTPTTNWIIVFGGESDYVTVSDTQVIELSKYMYTVVDTMCVLNNAIVSKNSFYFVNNSQNNWKMNILKLLCFVGQEISLLLVLPRKA